MVTDNIADMCSPSTTADLTEEVFVLSAAIRFYNESVRGKVSTYKEECTKMSERFNDTAHQRRMKDKLLRLRLTLLIEVHVLVNDGFPLVDLLSFSGYPKENSSRKKDRPTSRISSA